MSEITILNITKIVFQMKIIIIEGTDRTGKDTLIDAIKDMYERVLIIHCTTPTGDTNKEKIEKQNVLFNKYVDDIITDKYDGICDCVIFNRAWYGEYVYGQLYRNRTTQDVTQLIRDLENKLLSNTNNDIYYIQLVNNSMQLRQEHDDGKSLSSDTDFMKTETRLFKEVYDKSILHKRIVNVNNGDKFRDKNMILKEVREFIAG